MAALKVAGNSLEQIEALEVAGNAIMQDADAVSNALKVLSMRLRGTTGSALEEVGEDTEGLIEDFSKLNGKIKDLTKTVNNPEGVSIVDKMTGGYKSTYQILLEIAKVWQDIGDMQKAELLEIMAGKVRGAAAASILEAPELLEQAYNDALQNAPGAGNKAIEASIDSIDKKFTKLKNTASQFAIELFNSKDIKSIIDALTNLIEKATNGASTLSPVISALTNLLNLGINFFSKVPTTSLLSLLFTKKNVFGNIVNSISALNPAKGISQGDFAILKTAVDSTDDLADAYMRIDSIQDQLSAGTRIYIDELKQSGIKTTQAFSTAIQQQALDTQKLTIARKALNVAMSIGIAFLASSAISVINYVIHREEELAKETREAVNALKEATEEFERQEGVINDTIKKYEEYHDTITDVSKTEAEIYQARQDIYDVQKDLIDQFGETAKGIDLVNGKYETQLGLLRDLTVEERNKYIAENAGLYQKGKLAQSKYADELVRAIGGDADTPIGRGLREPVQNFLKDIGKYYDVDLDTVSASEYRQTLDNFFADWTANNAELKAALGDTYSDKFINNMWEEWGKIVNNESSSLRTAIDSESLIQTYDRFVLLNDKAFAPVYEKFESLVSQFEQAQVDGNEVAYAKLADTIYSALSDTEIPEKYQGVFESLFDRADAIREKHDKRLEDLAKQEAEDRAAIERAAENILAKKILGYDENGNQNPDRQFTSMGYLGDLNYGAPAKWDQKEIEEAYKALGVDTWEEIHIFDEAIKDAIANDIHDLNDLFDLYKKKLNESEEVKVRFGEWLEQESKLFSNEDEKEYYTNNALIEAYQSATNGFIDFLEKDVKGQTQINYGKIADYIADTEIFKQLGMNMFEDYVDGFSEDDERLKTLGEKEAQQYIEGFGKTPQALGAYIRDAFRKVMDNMDITELSDTSYDLLEDLLYNVNAEIFNVSESVMKIENSYWELRKLQEQVNEGTIFEKDQLAPLLEKYDLYGSIAETIEEVDEQTGKLIIKYKLEEGSIDSLVGEYASLSNEAITSLKEQSKYATETIQYLRQIQYELLQTKIDYAMIASGLQPINLQDLFASGPNAENVSRALSEAMRGLTDEEKLKVNQALNEASSRFYGLLKGYNLNYKVGDGSATGSGNGDDEKDNKSEFDWLDSYLDKRARKIDNLTSAYDRLSKQVIKSGNIEEQYYKKLNSNLDQTINALYDEISAIKVANKERNDRISSGGYLYKELVKAFDNDENKAQSVINQVKTQYQAEGIYSLKEYTSEQQSAISAIMTNYTNILDGEQKILEDEATIAEKKLQKFSNNIEYITKQYDDVLNEFANRQTQLEHYQTMRTNAGYMENQQYYIALLDNETRELQANISKREELIAQINELNPEMEDEVEKWRETKQQIDETTNAIYENEEAIVSLQASMRQLSWDLNDKIREITGNLRNETEFLIDTLGTFEKDMYSYSREYLGNDVEKTKIYNGQMSDEGLATLALRRVNMQSFEEELEEVNRQIAEVEQEYLQNTADTTVLDRLNTLKDTRYDIIQSYNDEREAIVDLVKDGYDKQLESLDAITSKYMEALQAEKD